MNNNYVYDESDATPESDDYWRGRDDGRLEAGGGLPTLLSGTAMGALAVIIIWIACKVML
jgi:hypothetical protein